jgi:hypothetical protein
MIVWLLRSLGTRICEMGPFLRKNEDRTSCVTIKGCQVGQVLVLTTVFRVDYSGNTLESLYPLPPEGERERLFCFRMGSWRA